MKTLTSKVLLATAVIMSLTACDMKEKVIVKEKVVENEKVVEKEKVVVEVDDKMSAEELADAGEQLMTPYTFMLADKVFDQALEKDANNLKAQFYKSFLKRFTVLKGIYARVRPLVAETGDLAKHDEPVKYMPNAPLKKFLLDGKGDLKTVTDVQNFISDYEDSLKSMHDFLKQNVDAELSLNLNPYFFEQEIKDEWGRSCVVVENTKESTKVECSVEDVAVKKMNAADLVSLRQIVGYERLIWALYNSYSFEGVNELNAKFKDKESTSLEQWAAINASPELLKLRSRANIGIAKDLMLDTAGAVRWAIKYQEQLCPKGEFGKNQRKGFLFSDGICIVAEAQDLANLDLAEKAIKGPIEHSILDNEGREIDKITVDLLAWSRKAPRTLKPVIVPVIRDYACGEKMEYADPTAGGILPNGDLAKVAGSFECDKK